MMVEESKAGFGGRWSMRFIDRPKRRALSNRVKSHIHIFGRTGYHVLLYDSHQTNKARHGKIVLRLRKASITKTINKNRQHLLDGGINDPSNHHQQPASHH